MLHFARARRLSIWARGCRSFSHLTAPVVSPSTGLAPPSIRSAYASTPSQLASASPQNPMTQILPPPSGLPETKVPPPTRSDSLDHHHQFWRKIPLWADVDTKDFISYRWGTANLVQGKAKLFKFLNATLPETLPTQISGKTETRTELVEDIFAGITAATMAVRMTPYVLSRIDWTNPRQDPIFRQFVPTKSSMLADHPKLTLDSLHEEADSPVKGLVHRYPDKALFLPTSVCPTYCMFCTRSYAVGADTDQVTKVPLRPTRRRWDAAFAYIEQTPALQDIVVSGGDSFYLQPEHIDMIGDRLISIPHVRRFRFASRGLAVSPNRILDRTDPWADAIIRVAKKARRAGKHMALHTHFNHANEISWMTEMAAQRFHEEGVIVRNQSVLLHGVNDTAEAMGALIRKLADNNIFPYYVYQCDMVRSIEHLRTPLSTILDIEAKIRGSIAGFMMPQFVVDLPGGGGKRLASTFKSYNPLTGKSMYEAPAVTSRGKENKIYEYYDPIRSTARHI